MYKGLRPYQSEIAGAVLDSVFHHKGLTFSVEIARQGGKNELSARLERLLLILNMDRPLQLVKCSPTFKPQTVISMVRLKDRLNDANFGGTWMSEMGYIVRLGNARAVFLSADVSSNVVGNTAHLLLEVDESQDVNKEKYTKEFKPMGATTNCTVVHYGTTWDDSTLLEEIKQTNLELEKKDGIKRHFRYDWQDVGKYNHDYLINVEIERQRLGENHPLFLTQYRLLPVHGGGGFLNLAQKAQLQGTHPRLHHPSSFINHESKFINHPVYVAGIDLAGEAERDPDDFLKFSNPRQDSTVLTIAELSVFARSEETKQSPNPFNSRLCDKRSDPRVRLSTRDVIPWMANPAIPPSSVMLEELSDEASQGGVVAPSLVIPAKEGIYSSPSIPLLFPDLNTEHCKLTTIKVVEHYSWTGVKHVDLYPQLVDLLKNVWHCKRVVVDSTGVGEPVAAFLKQSLGSRVVPFKFTAPSKSELGFNLLSAINSGRLKIYAADGSTEYREIWSELDKAKSFYRPSQTMNFYVDPSDGHDDFLMSLALLVEAASLYEPRTARGKNSIVV
jgi:hypothetical protein